jgi:hypothetical protein
MGKGGKEKEKEGKRKGKEKEKGTEKMGKEIPNRFCTSYRLLVILLLLMSLRVEKDVSTTSGLPVLAKQLRSKALTLLPPFPPLLVVFGPSYALQRWHCCLFARGLESFPQ